MKRGIVLEYNEKFVMFLTEDGYFLKDHKKKKKYELGEEITLFEILDEHEDTTSIGPGNKERISENI